MIGTSLVYTSQPTVDALSEWWPSSTQEVKSNMVAIVLLNQDVTCQSKSIIENLINKLIELDICR